MHEELVRRYYDKRMEREWQRYDRHRMEFNGAEHLLAFGKKA